MSKEDHAGVRYQPVVLRVVGAVESLSVKVEGAWQVGEVRSIPQADAEVNLVAETSIHPEATEPAERGSPHELRLQDEGAVQHRAVPADPTIEQQRMVVGAVRSEQQSSSAVNLLVVGVDEVDAGLTQGDEPLDRIRGQGVVVIERQEPLAGRRRGAGIPRGSHATLLWKNDDLEGHSGLT